MFVAPRPRKRWRTIARAISVPSAVATIGRDEADLERLDDGALDPEDGVPVDPVVEA